MRTQKKKKTKQKFDHGGGQNTDPQSMEYPHGQPMWTTPLKFSD